MIPIYYMGEIEKSPSSRQLWPVWAGGEGEVGGNLNIQVPAVKMVCKWLGVIKAHRQCDPLRALETHSEEIPESFMSKLSYVHHSLSSSLCRTIE